MTRSPNQPPRRVVFVVTEDWYFCSHRLALARALRDRGDQVVVATRVAQHAPIIRDAGADVLSLPWTRRSRSPINELRSLWKLAVFLREYQPDVIHHVAMKPLLVGALISGFAARNAARVYAVAGLGFVFTSQRSLARRLRPLFRMVLRRWIDRDGSTVIVQNSDDEEQLVATGLVSATRIVVIEGSGVDTSYFLPTAEASGPFTVVLPARMLWSKGVGEFVEAARRFDKTQHRFVLVGGPDPENPDSIPVATLREWVRLGWVEWAGQVDDVRPHLESAHVVVLPSYREGLPKSLLEAAACGKAIVTTDVPGCRAAVDNGNAGILVPVQEVEPLADAIARLAGDASLREQLGTRARALAVERFSIERVVAATLDLYDRVDGVQ